MRTEYEGAWAHLMVAQAALRKAAVEMPDFTTTYVRLRLSVSAQNVQEALRAITETTDGI